MTTTTPDRPFLAYQHEVRAMLAGRQTQFRRIVKPQPILDANGDVSFINWNGPIYCCNEWQDFPEYAVEHCPFGQPGTRLWVKETFASVTSHIVAYKSGGECGAWMDDGSGGRLWIHHGYVIEAPGYPFGLDRLTTLGLKKYGGKWRPSIHMPRWASRLTLEVENVRVERVQEISEADAIAEGCQCAGVPASLTNRGAFAKLWNSINGPNSWSASPWVLAGTFRVVVAG